MIFAGQQLEFSKAAGIEEETQAGRSQSSPADGRLVPAPFGLIQGGPSLELGAPLPLLRKRPRPTARPRASSCPPQGERQSVLQLLKNRAGPGPAISSSLPPARESPGQAGLL